MLIVSAGLLQGRAFFMRGWTAKLHFHAERVSYEVSNYEEPILVHAFPDPFEAAWFFLNLADDAEFIELPAPFEGL